MREKRTVQTSIFHFFADHEIGQELQVTSQFDVTYIVVPMELSKC